MERTAAGSAGDGSRKIEIAHMMSGADVITAGEEQLALGFPEEVVKAWLRAGKEPTAWLIPDRRSAGGIVQWALEFPLYHALFVRGLFGRGRKIPVLVQERHWRDVYDYLRLSLLGLTLEEMELEQVDPETARMLARESDHLALKRPDGAVARVEDFLEPRFFDAEGVATLGTLRVKSHGDNTWSFFSEVDRIEEYRLDTDEEPAPPYTEPLNPANAPSLPQPFEVIALGTGTGFDMRGPCTSLLVQAHGRSTLVDCGPYVRTLLEHSGVSLNQIGALVLTHAHEDHSVGLSALLGLTHRIKLYATRENVAIMRRKLAILNPGVTRPERLLDDTFDIVEVRPGVPYVHYGLQLTFHYTMHSIPCTGVEFRMEDGGVDHRVLVVGDNNSRANIERAGAEVLGEDRLNELRALFRWRGDLVLHDAGAGMIHGCPTDFESNPSKKVVCLHTHALEPDRRHLHTLARPGHRYTIVAENGRPTAIERGLAHTALESMFPGADPAWLSALLDGAEALNVNRGDLVVRVQEESTDLYVTITGELAVHAVCDGGPVQVATIQAGEIFGEMAGVNRAPRSATVQARTPVRLLRIPGGIFSRFAAENRLQESLPELWHKRGDLQAVGVLARATVSARNALARRATRHTITPGSTLIREGSKSQTVFVLVKGRVQVYKGDLPLLVEGVPVIVEPGTLIGEAASVLDQARNASIVALDECEVLAVRGPDFRRIVQQSPHLFCTVSRIVQERRAA